MRKIADIIMWLAMLLFMPAFGLLLSDIKDFRIYKLYNVIGIVWALLGFFYLSFLINLASHIKDVMIRFSHYLIVWVLFMLPFGLVTGGLVARSLGMQSWASVAYSGLFLLFPAILSVLLIEDFSEKPKFRFSKKENFNVLFLGGFFVVSGLLLQLAAAVFDLISFNG